MLHNKFQVIPVFCAIVLYIFTTANAKLSSKQKHATLAPDSSNNSIDEEPDWLDQYVTVSGNGQVRVAHLGASSSGKNDLLGVIPEKRIIGGKDVNKGDMPYQTSQQESGAHVCGGSIYNSHTILTAAQYACFYNGKYKVSEDILKEIEWVVGEHNLFSVDKSEQRTTAASITIHPQYEPKSGVNDIAIIKVKKPFVYNRWVQPLPIDYPPPVPEKVKWAWISGWGYTKQRSSGDQADNMYYPAILKRAQVEVFTRKECVDFFTKKYSKQLLKRLANGAICAGERAQPGATSVADGCQGDSGGPLACVNPKKHNLRFLCGIVSTGIGCGLPGLPGIYTRVADFQKWIIAEAGYADRRSFDF